MNRWLLLILSLALLLGLTNLGLALDQQDVDKLVKKYLNGERITSAEKEIISEYLSKTKPFFKGNEANRVNIKNPALRLGSRSVLLSEDFSSGALPTGWQNVDNIGGGEVWYFNNPGGQTLNSTTGANGFAIFDSDFNGSSSGPEDADLITPPIDCSTFSTVTLQFEHYFRAGLGGAGELFVSGDNGATWTSLESWGASSTPNAELKQYDISAIAAGQSQVLIKWNWTGDWSWWWAVDDVIVEGATPPAYLVNQVIDGGNPGGLNTDSDFTTTGWTSITTGTQSTNSWSAPQALPFPFEFFGPTRTVVDSFKVSQNMVLTFDVADTTLPGANTNLPSASLPDLSIACYWDEFTNAPPTGSNDVVYTKTFGTAPNRQFWIRWHSFEYGNPNTSFQYNAIVLEETSNTIYLVDMYGGSASTGLTTTAGLQKDASTAVQFGDSLLPLAGNGSSNTDNDYIEFFVPSPIDLAVSEFINFPASVLAGSAVNFDVVVSNVGSDPVAGATLDIFLNGTPSSSLSVGTLNSGESDTLAASVTASASGRDSVVAALQMVSGDANPANDTLSAAYDVETSVATPFFEDFEGLNPANADSVPAGWRNEINDDFDWWADNLGTPSSGTGPAFDHTTGDSGIYMYTESSSPNYPNKIAHLTTPFLDLTGLTNPVLEFWYHMFGAAMGELHVDVNSGGVWTLDAMPPLVGQQHTSETAPWSKAVVDLSPWSGSTVKIRFRGITGSSFTSDMAIDDVFVGEASFDVAALGVAEPNLLTKMPLSQSGLVSSITYTGTFRNLGPSNTGDVNLDISDAFGTSVFSHTIAGVTISGFSDSSFTYGAWDASLANPDIYTIASYASNFSDSDPSNDTTYNVIELGDELAYDDGNHTNSVAIISTDRSVLGTRFTLTNDDTLMGVDMLITSSTTATDSFSIDIFTAVADTPGTMIARIFRGTYGDLGTLPALVSFVVSPGLSLSAGDFFVLIDSDSTGNPNFPLGVSATGPGARNLPHRFGGYSPGFQNGAWLWFEVAGNPVFHGFTNIIRAVFPGVGVPVHDFAVDSLQVQACLVVGATDTVAARVSNLGNQSETDVTIELRENGTFAGDALVSLNPGESTTVTFPYTPSDTGVVKLEVISLLPGDVNPANDVDSAFVRVFEAGREMVFVDDFEDTTFTFANWIIVDDPTSTNTWMIFPPPYPNVYTLPITSRGNVFSADADNAGSGSITITTAMISLDLSAYDSLQLDFDSDWNVFDSQDTARVNVSNDGGATWTTVLEWPGPTDVRNVHATVNLTPYLANSANAVIAFESYQPGWDWWWTIDNVCVSGVSGVQPPIGYVQSFEGAFPPPFWSKLNPDSGSGWNQQANGTSPIPGWTGGTITVPPGGENFVAFCTWGTGGPVFNDQYLVTPRLVNIQSGDSISFWLRYWPDTYNDTLDVVISTTDPSDPANFNILVDQLGFGAGSDTTWQMYSYDLSSHVSPGSDAYIGFREHVQDNWIDGASFSFDLFSTNALVDTGQIAEPEKLLITEIVVTPTEGEFVEIFNPNADSVDLSDYYLTDATFAGGNTYYYQIVQGGGGGGGFADWHARFPDGAMIAPGEYQTVALAGDSAFYATYGVLPTYELFEDGHANPSDVPDMREAFPGSINNQGGLTNSDEVVILYHWDGVSDLVGDVDYLIYDANSPAAPNEAVDKTGICIDGPDPDTLASCYLPDTPISDQRSALNHGNGFSTHRVDYLEGNQLLSGSNGVGGRDETSEDLDSTFTNNSLPSPNRSWIPSEAVPFCDNFEAYVAGTQLGVQSSPTWTTWSGSVGTGEDPFVSDAYAYNGSNSVVIVQNNDLVKTFGSLTSGKWLISFQIYIPSGKAGYFNTLAGFTPNPFNWGMECYFDVGGNGRLFGGSPSPVAFSYAYDTWQLVEVLVDLDNDQAVFSFNGSAVHSWQWTAGASGGGSPLRLDASDFFGATANDEMYFDDYCVREIPLGIDDEIDLPIPKEFALQQNYPNPFNPTTTFRYQLPKTADVKIVIFNILGQKVKTLVDGRQEPGYYETQWDALNDHGSKVASGVYIYRMQAGDFVKTRKMILLK